jgi:hypothetical protein
MTFGIALWLLLATPTLITRPSMISSDTAAPPSEVAALVDRYIAWRGGAAYLGLASIHEKGRLEGSGLTGTVERYAGRDGSEWQRFVLGGFEGSSAVTTSGGWSENRGVVQEMAQASARDTRRQNRLELGSALEGQSGVTISAQPDESRDGRTWAVLRVEFGGPDRYDAFLDRATGELLGWRITQNRVTRFHHLGDWRTIDGVRMPFLIEDLFDNPASNTVQHDETVEVNVPLPDSLFARPKSVEMAHFGGGRSETDPVPFTFYNSNRIYIPGQVNGHAVDLLLDSGAGTTVLDTHYADSIGLETEGKGVANGTGGQAGVAFAHDVRVTIGNMTLRVPTVAVIDLSGVAKRLGMPMPAILGADVFKQLIVDLDFGRRTIAFHDPAGFTVPAGAVTVPATQGGGLRTVPVRIENGPEVQVAFDIGNGGPLLIYPSYWQSHHLLSHRTVSAHLSGGVGGARQEKVITVKRLTFAGHTFHNVPAVLSSPGVQAVDADRSAGNVGLPVYSRFRLMTDYPHDRLYLIPNAKGLDAPFPRDRSGLSVVKEGAGLKVLFVAPGSPAKAAGWKAGEIITAVNGHPIGDDYNGSALSHWNEGTAGTTVTLTLSDGSTRTVTLRDYY